MFSLVLAVLAATNAPAADEKPPATVETKPAVDPKADVLMRRMGDYLAESAFFSVNAEIWQDIQLGSGQQVQAGRTVEMQVRRPDRMHAEVHSSRRSRGLYYDGKTIQLINRVQNFYGSIPAPASLARSRSAS